MSRAERMLERRRRRKRFPKNLITVLKKKEKIIPVKYEGYCKGCGRIINYENGRIMSVKDEEGLIIAYRSIRACPTKGCGEKMK